jgi:hypothetical protein
MKSAILLGAVLASVASPPLAASPTPDAAVAIRTYNYAHVTPEQLTASRSAANRIFEGAGISLQWIDCRVSELDSGLACTEQLRDGREFVLRLMERAPHRETETNRVVALGTSILDRDARGGALITIDLHPVRSIAKSAATDPAVLLGRAVAHELGHLLLGRSDHSRAGLMRAFWSQDELRGMRPADWRFSPNEALHMRQGLMARIRAAN